MEKAVGRRQVVVVTGASRGIGRETARRFARAGSSLVLTYRRESAAAETLAGECRSLGAPEAEIRELDLTSAPAIAAFAAEAAARHPAIDVLVNNAGVIVWKRLAEQDEEDVSLQIGTNLAGAILLTRALLPRLRAVVNVGSDLATFGMADLTVYCATKFGLRGFTQALALENPGLRVLCVNPDRAATAMNGFQGRDPAVAAEVIFRAASGLYDVPNGGDVNVWEVGEV